MKGGFLHRLRVLNRGFRGIVNRLPVQAVEFGVRMAVAHGAPDQLEGFEVLGLLFSRQLGKKRAAKNGNGQKNKDRPAGKHVAIATIACQTANIVRNGCAYLGTIRRYRPRPHG